ncbi:MAG: hypothetical protein J0L84_20600, partial [Verrucomicrobia bacterium]|nr:hypothetical protein [Verrucomicrobiota bacterium]
MRPSNTTALRLSRFRRTAALLCAVTAIPALVIQSSSAPPLRPLDIAWEAELSTGVEQLFDAVRSPDGYYLTGSTPFQQLDRPWGGWVARVSDSGEILWRKTLPEPFSSNWGSIATASDGSILVATDGFRLTRLSPQGDVQWKLAFGSGGYSTSLLGTSKGGCLAAGVSHRGDVRVIADTAAGRLSWELTFGGFGAEGGGVMAAAPNDGFYLGTTTASPMSDDVPGPGRGLVDAWLLRLDPLGQALWQRRYGGSGNDGIMALASADDGGCWVAISSDSPADG